VIAKATAAEPWHSAGAVLHQKVRIRRWRTAPFAESVADYDVWRSTGRSRVIAASLETDPAGELRAVYEQHGVRWERPLAATTFATLRASLGEARDHVSHGDLITLTSAPRIASGEIRQIELTLRKSDWRPVAERIDMASAGFEITELRQETVPVAAMDPGIFGDQTAAVRLPAPLAPIAPPEIVAAVQTGPSAEQLAEAEVRAREVLHQTGADIQDVVRIEQRESAIHVRLWTETGNRKDELTRALEHIPYVSAEVYDSASTSPDALPEASPRQLYTTHPPLAEALSKYLGGIDPTNRYLDEVRDGYLGVLRDAGALERLAQRYQKEEWHRLPAALQRRVDAIAADHVLAMRANAAGYLPMLAVALDGMHAPAAEPPGTAPAECRSWLEATPDLAANLRRAQESFWRLFVTERLDAPVTLSADELLRDASRARAEFSKELHRVCVN
jgi:hypothetical protein